MRACSLFTSQLFCTTIFSCSLTFKERIYLVSIHCVSLLDLLATINLYYQSCQIIRKDPNFFFSDLSKNTGLKKSILECFNHNSEEVKSAASYALGNISLGNLKEYLPFVLNEIETQPKRQYLLLHSLKEVNQNWIFSRDLNDHSKSRPFDIWTGFCLRVALPFHSRTVHTLKHYGCSHPQTLTFYSISD